MRPLFLFERISRPERKVASKNDACWKSTDLELFNRWCAVAREFFPENPALAEYELVWSTRSQRRVLGSCNLVKKRVRVARAMDRPELIRLLDALLYHEMCHAVVGMRVGVRGRRVFHGAEFREMERRHPGSVELDQWIRDGGWRNAVRRFASHVGSSNRKRGSSTRKLPAFFTLRRETSIKSIKAGKK